MAALHDEDEDNDKPQLQPLTEAEQDAVEAVVSGYQQSMTADAANYLKARGIDRSTAEHFRLGVCLDPSPGDERHRGSLVIPYLDKHGKALTYRFRCIQEHDHRALFHGKYASRKADPPRLFNVSAIFGAGDTLEVTEGEFDAMILTKLGMHAVAVPGAEHWKPHHSRMVAGFNKVRMWADADEAGMDLLRKVRKSVRNTVGLYLPTRTDVSSIYVDEGPQALLDLAAA